MQANILPFYTPSTTGWGQKVKTFFFLKDLGHVTYQIKRKELEHFASKMFDLMHTPDLFGWVKRSGIEIVQIGILNN